MHWRYSILLLSFAQWCLLASSKTFPHAIKESRFVFAHCAFTVS